jgi:transglutaminase-like putative cysteine protease
MPYNVEAYLKASACIDSDATPVVTLANSLTNARQTDLEKAVTLYYWVRDSILYNPYSVGTTRESLKATATLAAGEGWCVPKAVLLAALCRAVAIPARVGFADVRNHLSTERMRATMKTDVFFFHGYCSIYLDQHWVKATPAFNNTLCEKFGLIPLEFDGIKNSLYHQFDVAGKRHMEYLRDRGEYLDVPFEEMMSTFKQHYPMMFETNSTGDRTQEQKPDSTMWLQDVKLETQKY